MSNLFRTTVLCLAFTMMVPVYATSLTSTPMTETGKGTSTSEESVLSESERVLARSWGLSEVEWRRYQQLMQGIRGSISPKTISPIEVLGIHAQNEAERQQYAEAWARAMHEDVDRILAFQHAYDTAMKRLYPNEELIDINRLKRDADKSTELQSSDRLLFFTKANCPVCDALLGKVLRRVDQVAGIDIYITGEKTSDDKSVRDWAKGQAIKPEWVRSRHVTLNHDAGALEKLTQGEGQVPVLMRRRGDAVSQLRASDL